MSGCRTAPRCRTASATATRCCGSAARSADAPALAKAFVRDGAPFAVLDIDDDAAREIYGYDYLLLRPDLHVVWRGNAPPDEPERLAAMATGH